MSNAPLKISEDELKRRFITAYDDLKAAFSSSQYADFKAQTDAILKTLDDKLGPNANLAEAQKTFEKTINNLHNQATFKGLIEDLGFKRVNAQGVITQLEPYLMLPVDKTIGTAEEIAKKVGIDQSKIEGIANDVFTWAKDKFEKFKEYDGMTQVMLGGAALAVVSTLYKMGTNPGGIGATASALAVVALAGYLFKCISDNADAKQGNRVQYVENSTSERVTDADYDYKRAPDVRGNSGGPGHTVPNR